MSAGLTSTARKRLLLSAAAVGGAAFLLFYLFGWYASRLPVLSEVSLACAFDTAGKRLLHAFGFSFWALLLTFPLLYWRAKKSK